MSGDFLAVRKIGECMLMPESPMAVAMSYPLLVVVPSASQVVTFDVPTNTTCVLTRNGSHGDVTVLASSVSRDATLIATAGATETGGELVVWSVASGHEIATISTDDGISHVEFCANARELVYATIQGCVQVVVLTKLFRWQLKPKYNFGCDIGTPLTCLKVWGTKLLIGSQSGTSELDMAVEGLPGRCIGSDEVMCFGAYAHNEYVVMARATGHDVCLTQMRPGPREEIIQFGETPSHVVIIDPISVVVIFPTKVTLASRGAVMTADVPKGLCVVDDGRIYIIADGFYEVNVVGHAERIEYYATQDKWDFVFGQIMSATDVGDLNGLLRRYINSVTFDAEVLMDVLEKLKATDLLVLGILQTKRVELLTALVKSNRIEWVLNATFVKEIITVVDDEMAVGDFLMCVELDLLWLDEIVRVCCARKMFDVIASLLTKYRRDYYATYVIAYSKGDAAGVFSTAAPLLDDVCRSPALFDDTVAFLERHSVGFWIQFDESRATALFKNVLKRMLQLKRPMNMIVNNMIMGVARDSEIWVLIARVITQKSVKIEANLLPLVEDFIFFNEGEYNEAVSDLLVMLLTTGHLSDLEKWLVLSRSKRYADAEFEVIRQLGNTEELLIYLVTYKVVSFKEKLLIIVPDKSDLREILSEHYGIFLFLNADEYCELVWFAGDRAFAHRIGDSLGSRVAEQWHFYKRVFKKEEFVVSATDTEILIYVEFLSRFDPTSVIDAVRSFKQMPIVKVLDITQRHAIVDATLHMCELMHDYDRARVFAVESIFRNLMDTQDVRVVEQVCSYISTSSYTESDSMWLSVFEAFQLPAYAYRDDSVKLGAITTLLLQFMESMVSDVDDSVIVSRRFTQLFSFLPFTVARPILSRFLHFVREKHEFSGTLARVVKHEAVDKQIAWVRDLAAGQVYDASRCLKCRRRLRQGDVIAAPCGHVFHRDCVHDGWCAQCSISFSVSDAPRSPTRSHKRPPLWNADPDQTLPAHSSIAGQPRIGIVTRL